MKLFPTDYPKKLKLPSGVELVLDESRVLIEFRKRVRSSDTDKTLEAVGIEPIQAADAANGKEDSTQKVNHTGTRLWCRLSKRAALGTARAISSVEHAAGVPIHWIGPVYRIPKRRDMGALLCPLPNVLLVRLCEDTPEAREKRLGQLANMGLKHDAVKSLMLEPFDYFTVEDLMHDNAYVLRERLAASGVDIDDVRFETMPLLKPTTLVPNDTLFASQWNMTQIGATAPRISWDLSRGSRSVVICILDEGCDLGHPDLRFASNGINLGSMSGDGSPTGPHGTACAGIASAVVHNNLGVAGVAGDCSILPVAFENWTDVEVAAGINFAASNGADVISMSFGHYAPADGFGPSGWDFDLIDPAIERASRQGVVLVAATGNENRRSHNRYPARHPMVIAVGASDQNDNRKSPASPDGETWGSNFGSGVSVVAPGVLIPTTDQRGSAGYNTASGAAGNFTLGFNGTSSATPHVAGLAALIRTVCPTFWNTDVQNIIERTAAKVGTAAYAVQAGFENGTRNRQMGYGRISVDEALREAFLFTVACIG